MGFNRVKYISPKRWAHFLRMKALNKKHTEERVYKNEEEKTIRIMRVRRMEKSLFLGLLYEQAVEFRKRRNRVKKMRRIKERKERERKKMEEIIKKGLNRLKKDKKRRMINSKKKIREENEGQKQTQKDKYQKKSIKQKIESQNQIQIIQFRKNNKEEKRGQNQFTQYKEEKRGQNQEFQSKLIKDKKKELKEKDNIQLISLINLQNQNKKKREKGKNKYKIKINQIQDNQPQTKHFITVEEDHQNYLNEVQQLLRKIYTNREIKWEYITMKEEKEQIEMILRRRLRIKQGTLKISIEIEIRNEIENQFHRKKGLLNKIKKIIRQFEIDTEKESFENLSLMKKFLRIGGRTFFLKNKMQYTKAEIDITEKEIAIFSIEKIEI